MQTVSTVLSSLSSPLSTMKYKSQFSHFTHVEKLMTNAVMSEPFAAMSLSPHHPGPRSPPFSPVLCRPPLYLQSRFQLKVLSEHCLYALGMDDSTPVHASRPDSIAAPSCTSAMTGNSATNLSLSPIQSSLVCRRRECPRSESDVANPAGFRSSQRSIGLAPSHGHILKPHPLQR